MPERKCFLFNCAATIGDCKKMNCECLKCLGVNKNNCEILYNSNKSITQQILCDRCKNCKGSM